MTCLQNQNTQNDIIQVFFKQCKWITLIIHCETGHWSCVPLVAPFTVLAPLFGPTFFCLAPSPQKGVNSLVGGVSVLEGRALYLKW